MWHRKHFSFSLDKHNALDNGRDPIKVLQHTFALFCLDAYVNGHVITSTLDRYFRDYRCILQQSMPNVVLLSWIVALMPLIVL